MRSFLKFIVPALFVLSACGQKAKVQDTPAPVVHQESEISMPAEESVSVAETKPAPAKKVSKHSKKKKKTVKKKKI